MSSVLNLASLAVFNISGLDSGEEIFVQTIKSNFVLEKKLSMVPLEFIE